jgi:hypothetical protein
LIQQLEAFVEAVNLKKQPETLPDFPVELEYLFDWFNRISKRRRVGMESNRINFTEIQAFANLNQLRMKVWEVQTIERLDDALFRAWEASNEKRKQKRRNDPKDTTPAQIDVKDTKSLKQLFRAMKAKKEHLGKAKNG